ncbi:NADH dehydrogenase (ubiquinone) complex I, assembly factor 6 homolog sicily [Rhynchophorus ferrugineus]|uniref:NADH dehydrogenase (Ubiquinone) complex I, assembly factor 6 n=1 Tax=Rhynchophorus ferrugineus TaxID=354439 RepID=A0A834MID5_RHYFE|nr:hypothetical protein GWI33_000540 [Rhynchophorus ferrugineus]
MHILYKNYLALNKSIIPKTICRLKSSRSSSQYCLDQLRNYDYENFVCTILLKNIPRSVALAVRSFNVEVSRVAEQVSQETIGLMRLKFWEEAIDKCYSGNIKYVPKHPVTTELYKAISKANLTKRYLKNLVSARTQYINVHGFKTLTELEKYSDQTVASVFYLILEGCGVKNVDADHAASHLGKSQGIIQQLRSIPHARKLNFLPIPEDLLIKYQISQEEVLRSKESQKLSDCVYEIASRAHQHLVKSRSLIDKVPANGRAALLPAIPVSIYLDRLQELDYNILDHHLQIRTWKLLPSLYINNLRNRY